MALKFRKRAIAVKIEPVYGTDAVPTFAANAMQVNNVSITPLEIDTLNRDLVGRGIGSEAQAIVGKRVKLEFDVEMAGAGAAGTAPAWAPVLRACGMAETTNAGIDVQYDPVDENEDAVSVYFNFDGILFGMVGVRGDWGYKLDAKGYPYLMFTFTGLWVAPVTSAYPVVSWAAFIKPVHVGNANTTFSLHAYAATMAAVDYTHGNVVAHRDLVGTEDVQITDRAPSGSVTIEHPALADQDFYTVVVAETQAPMQIIQGTTAGNIVQIDHPKVQLLSAEPGESDSFATLKMGLNVIPDVGNDETKITVK